MAVQFAFDKEAYNAASRGEDLALANLRNMYTHPEFVSLSSDVTVEGKTFKAAKFMLSGILAKAADTNNDGRYTISDYIAIKRFVAGRYRLVK